jgi:hypothetical protein
MKKTPNPWNDRAARVADALMLAAHERKVAVQDLSRKEIREILKGRGLYTSEGSLSRDLAAIRKTLPEFGGPRTPWARGASKVITINGQQRVLVRADLLPARAISSDRQFVLFGGGGNAVSVKVKVYKGDRKEQILMRARSRALEVMHADGGSGAVPYPAASPRFCPECGRPTMDGGLCDECAEALGDEAWEDDDEEEEEEEEGGVDDDIDELWAVLDDDEARRWVRSR